jgi:hypothetical protein
MRVLTRTFELGFAKFGFAPAPIAMSRDEAEQRSIFALMAEARIDEAVLLDSMALDD